MSIETIGYTWHSEDARRLYEKAEIALAEHDEQWKRRYNSDPQHSTATEALKGAYRTPEQWADLKREFETSRASLVKIMVDALAFRTPIMAMPAPT